MTSVWGTDACWERNRHLLLSLKSFFLFFIFVKIKTSYVVTRDIGCLTILSSS